MLGFTGELNKQEVENRSRLPLLPSLALRSDSGLPFPSQTLCPIQQYVCFRDFVLSFQKEKIMVFISYSAIVIMNKKKWEPKP